MQSCSLPEILLLLLIAIGLAECSCNSSQQQQTDPNFPDIPTQSWYPPSVVGSSSRPSTPTSSSASPHQRASDHPQSSSRGQPSPAEAAGIIARLKDKRLAHILIFFHDLLLRFYLSCIQYCLISHISYGIWIAIDILCYLRNRLYVFTVIPKLGHLAKLYLDLCHATSLILIP